MVVKPMVLNWKRENVGVAVRGDILHCYFEIVPFNCAHAPWGPVRVALSEVGLAHDPASSDEAPDRREYVSTVSTVRYGNRDSRAKSDATAESPCRWRNALA